MNQQDVYQRIKSLISKNKVIVFIKGTKIIPQCGFSSIVVQILKKINIDFECVNVLEDNELREAIKIHSDWPTIPQLYIDGEFIGGCDIVKEQYATGELKNKLHSYTKSC